MLNKVLVILTAIAAVVLVVCAISMLGSTGLMMALLAGALFLVASLITLIRKE